MNAQGLSWSRKMLIPLLGTSGKESGFHWNIPHWIFIHEQILTSGDPAALWRLESFSRNQFMRAWHCILPLWKLKIPILAPNLERFHAENTRTFTRRQQNILISICPVLYKCIKYQLSIQWNITKIKEPEKASSTPESWGQDVADPTRNTLWAFQDFHGSHLRQGSGIKMTKMRLIDWWFSLKSSSAFVGNAAAATWVSTAKLMLWFFMEKGQDRNYSKGF